MNWHDSDLIRNVHVPRRVEDATDGNRWPPGNELINNDKNFIINDGIRNKFGGGITNGIRDGI